MSDPLLKSGEKKGTLMGEEEQRGGWERRRHTVVAFSDSARARGGAGLRGRCTRSRLRTRGPGLACSPGNVSHERVELEQTQARLQCLEVFIFLCFSAMFP